MFAITKATIPSLFVRFVLCMKGTVLENFILLTFKKCIYFEFVSLFYLIVFILGMCPYLSYCRKLHQVVEN